MSFYIDLGTENTLIYRQGQGLLLNEPSFISFRNHGQKRDVLAIGTAAKSHLGRTPTQIEVERPLREGVIANFYAAERMLHEFFKKIQPSKMLFKKDMIISLPCKVTEFERRAVSEVGMALGARRVHLIDEPMAAAIGVGLQVAAPSGQMIVDIGGGTTEIAVISLGGVAYANAVRVGGHEMDLRIAQHLRNKFNILVGEPTAEKLKILYAEAFGDSDEKIHFRGVDLASGLPKLISLPQREIYLAIAPVLEDILAAIRVALGETPPELASDIVDNGLWLAGGGALIKNLPERVSQATGLKVKIAPTALMSVALGGAYLLDHPELLEKIGS